MATPSKLRTQAVPDTQDTLRFTKEEYARLVGLDGKIDVLVLKFDAFTNAVGQQMSALASRDDAQAEKLDAHKAQIDALNTAATVRDAKTSVYAKAWSAIMGIMAVLASWSGSYLMWHRNK